MVAQKTTKEPPEIQCSCTDVAIIGGGVVGVIAAKRMLERGIDFTVLEKLHDVGGVWHTHSNNHSTLQAPEGSYRTHPEYPLGTRGPLEQISGNVVLTRLRTMAREIGVIEHTEFNSEVKTIRTKGDDYMLVIKDVRTGQERHLLAQHIIVCHGILGRQYLPEERGLAISKNFKGVFSMGGRMHGKDCAVSSIDVNGKSVVIVGGGAFACEAMRSAVLNGASSITMVTREKSKWIIPFSRQFLSSAISLTPLVPWAWKMALVKTWLTHCYYKPCHLEHLIPAGGPKDMNYTGQSHDGFFEFARDGRVQHVLGTAEVLDDMGVCLKDGTVLPADLIVYCGGCEYQGSPSFLAELHLGFEDLHSFAFLGNSGRICTASDGLFSYVPAGPNKQIDMFLHAYDLHKADRLEELQQALVHTPIPHDNVVAKGHRTVWYTWFETFGQYSSLSCLFELRNRAYWKVMVAGRSKWGRVCLGTKIICGDLAVWLLLCILGVMEKSHKWRIYI